MNGETLSDNNKIEQVCALEIYDGHLKQKINIELGQMCDIYYFQLKTLSQSEHGFDLSVQGISFAMVIPFSNALSIKGSLEVMNV